MLGDICPPRACCRVKVDQLSEDNLKLRNDLSKSEDNLTSKQEIIESLQRTIVELTKSINRQTPLFHAGTQTDFVGVADLGTQTVNEICDKEIQVTGLSVGRDLSGTPVTSNDDRPSTSGCRTVGIDRPRILLLGDSHFRDMATIAMNIFGAGYTIQSIFKPNGRLQDVVCDLPSLTASYSSSDFVLLCAGCNDILRGLSIKEQYLHDIFRTLSKTNLILLTVPYWSDKAIYNNYVYEYNSKLCSLVESVALLQSIAVVDVNRLIAGGDMTRHGLHMRKLAKYKVMDHMFTTIQDLSCSYAVEVSNTIPYVNFSNLVRVDCGNDPTTINAHKNFHWVDAREMVA